MGPCALRSVLVQCRNEARPFSVSAYPVITGQCGIIGRGDRTIGRVAGGQFGSSPGPGVRQALGNRGKRLER